MARVDRPNADVGAGVDGGALELLAGSWLVVRAEDLPLVELRPGQRVSFELNHGSQP